MIPIIEKLAPISNCRSGRKLVDWIGCTVHETDNEDAGANAWAHAKYLQGGGKDIAASWHYAVDDTQATHSIPDDEIAWHAGDTSTGNGNTKTNGIEICVNKDGNFEKAFDNGCQLCAYLLNSKGVSIAKDYLFQHNHWSGKNCPSSIRRNGRWQEFIDKTQKYLNEMKGLTETVATFTPNATVDVTKAVPAQSSANTYDTETDTSADGYVDGNSVKERVQILQEGTVKNAEGYVRYLIKYKAGEDFKERWINSKWIIKDIVVTPPTPTIDYKALSENLQLQIQGKDKTITDLLGTIGEKDKAIGGLSSDLNSKTAEIAILNVKVDELNKVISGLNDNINSLNNEIVGLKNNIDVANQLADSMKDKIIALQSKVDELSKEDNVDKSDTWIKRLIDKIILLFNK